MSSVNVIDVRKIIWNLFSVVRSSAINCRVVPYILHAYQADYFSHYNNNYFHRSVIESASDLERELFNVYEPHLVQMQNNGALRTILSNLSECDIEWLRANRIDLFEGCIKVIAEIEGKATGEFTQPMELSHFIAQISGYDGNGSLYNPFAGTASYCTTMGGSGRVVGQEVNKSTWAIGVLRMLAYGMDASSLYCEDSLLMWRGNGTSVTNPERFDCIVATPPFGMRVNNSYHNNGYSSVEDIFINNCLNSISSYGTAIGVFPMGVTFRSGKSQELRQHYINRDQLDTVISLPAGVFNYTSIPTVILKFSNNKEWPGTVRFVNGENFFIKGRGKNTILFSDLLSVIENSDEEHVKFISIDQIRGNEYNILPSIYFKTETVIPEGFDRISLGDILDIENGERCHDTDIYGKTVSISSLSDNPFDYLLDMDSLTTEEINRNYRKIACPVLLLSKVRTLKPTYAKATEETPIYINPNVIAFKVKSPDSVYIPEVIRCISQIEVIQKGAVIPSINTGVITATQIDLPKDYDIQKALYHNAEREYKSSLVKKHGLEGLVKSQKMEFVSTIQRRQHDLNNMLRKVRNACNVVSMSLSERGYDVELLDEDTDITFANALHSMETYLDAMSNVINHLADDVEYATPEVLDLVPRLKAICEQRHRNFSIRFSPDSNSLCDPDEDKDEYHAYIKFGSINLDSIFFNIIQNAEKHGFVDPSRTDYVIDVELSHDFESKCFIIRIKNNGKPFPAGVDTKRYGRRAEPAGATGGNGDGGAIIKSTVEHYGGHLEVINDPEAWFPVCIELKIPRYYE